MLGQEGAEEWAKGLREEMKMAANPRKAMKEWWYGPPCRADVSCKRQKNSDICSPRCMALCKSGKQCKNKGRYGFDARGDLSMVGRAVSTMFRKGAGLFGDVNDCCLFCGVHMNVLIYNFQVKVGTPLVNYFPTIVDFLATGGENLGGTLDTPYFPGIGHQQISVQPRWQGFGPEYQGIGGQAEMLTAFDRGELSKYLQPYGAMKRKTRKKKKSRRKHG